MLLSIALISLTGMLAGQLCRKIRLPSLIGMLAAGILLGPFVFGLIDDSILKVSADIRKAALIIILTRAGLGLDFSVLKKLGRPALLMCFLPATFELAGMLLLGPSLLGLSHTESAVTGAVLAAVSPAVVVPRMVKLMDEKYGTKSGIPQLILAGASVDDVYVIVLFTTFTGMLQGHDASLLSFINIPVSIILGTAAGLVSGLFIDFLFRKFSINNTYKILIITCVSFLLVSAENSLNTPITFASLISVMFIGTVLKRKDPELAKNISDKFSKLWTAAEIFLFVLVGASVNIRYIGKTGVSAVILIAAVLVFRMAGVFISISGTGLKRNEKLFTMLAYTPKATVQAAIGGIPLSLGLDCGDTVLAVAVLAIVITAPVGAFAIDNTYRKLLSHDCE